MTYNTGKTYNGIYEERIISFAFKNNMEHEFNPILPIL